MPTKCRNIKTVVSQVLLTDHVKWKGHISKLLDVQINSVLAGVSEPLKTIYMYGTQPLFHNILKSKPFRTIRPFVHMKDQKVNMVAILLALLAEKGLPFTMTCRSIFGCCFILEFFKTQLWIVGEIFF